MKPQTLFEHAEQIPPFLCRIIARKHHGWEAMSVREIAAISGIPKTKVAIISNRRTWKGIPIDQVERFAQACGVDLMTPWKYKKWLRGSNLIHIQRARRDQKECFIRLLKGGHESIAA